MWDFLREMGEANVGGIELLKRKQDEGNSVEDKMVGRTRTRNIAKAYGWWIAKDCCTLVILKVRCHTHFILKHSNCVLASGFYDLETPDSKVFERTSTSDIH